MTCLNMFGFVTTPWKRGCLVSVPMYEKTHPLKVHGWMGRLESHGGDFATRYWTPLGRWSRSWLSKTCLELQKKQGVKCWFHIVQTEISKWFYISGYWHTVWNTWSPLHFFWFQGLVMFDPYNHQVEALEFRSLRSCAFSGLFGWPIATAFYGPAKRFFTCCGQELGVAKFDATLARMSYEYWRWYMYVQEVFSRYWECISFAVFHIYVIIFMAFHRLM